jgi:hypothetical protein
MILTDLFNMLTTGVFANTTLSGTDGVLKEEHYEKVCNLINLGIVEIYKRFKLLENELVLHITPETRNYYLRSSRAIIPANITVDQYIEIPDYTEGFLNIIKVLNVYDSSGNEIRMNYNPPNLDEPYLYPVIVSLAKDTLQITNITIAQTINIVYQSYPTKLVASTLYDPDTYELNIDENIIDPLVAYIAAKTFKPMGANDSTANADKSATYEQSYELACQKLGMYGLPLQDRTERATFKSNGWV